LKQKKSAEVIGNAITAIEEKYRKSKKRLIIECDNEEFMNIENTDNDYNEFIDNVRDLMNIKILIKECSEEWLLDNNYRRSLMKESEVVLMKIRENLISSGNAQQT